MTELELAEAEWQIIQDFWQGRVTGHLDREMLGKLCRDHTKLIERLKSEIDWAQVLLL